MPKGQGFGLGLGKMKELANAFQQAQRIQEDAKQLQTELEQTEVEGTSEDGQVKVVMSGNQEPLRVEISPAALEKGADALAADVTTAMKVAYGQSSELMKTRMEDLTSGINLPGLG
ncbi:MAG: YbaB/EbfC family nucleoid-associated protein [Cyanobacteria bacterium P01_H01_bin.15]